MIANLLGVQAMYKFGAHVLHPNLVGVAGHAGTCTDLCQNCCQQCTSLDLGLHDFSGIDGHMREHDSLHGNTGTLYSHNKTSLEHNTINKTPIILYGRTQL